MSPAYLPLSCSAGECGLVLVGSSVQCPVPCHVHADCTSCLRAPHCGWCALVSLNGRGLCMEGGPGPRGPYSGQCSPSLFNDSLPGYNISVMTRIILNFSTLNKAHFLLRLFVTSILNLPRIFDYLKRPVAMFIIEIN